MSARSKPPAISDAGQLALLESIAEHHPYRDVARYCRRLSKGVRLTCAEDLWNVTMLCAWEHAFGEYQESVIVSGLLDGYVFEDYLRWGPVSWAYGIVVDAQLRPARLCERPRDVTSDSAAASYWRRVAAEQVNRRD